MNKLLIIMIFVVFISGCTTKDDAQLAVTNYLDSYINNDEIILRELKKFVDQEQLTAGQKDLYKSLLKRQYHDLKYEIVNIEYIDNDAVIAVDIVVYDYYKAQKMASEYLETNPSIFTNPTGEYDANVFLEYKLNLMNTTTYTNQYSLDILVTKKNGKWYVNQPTKITLEKIHGIYNYEHQ